MARRRDEEVIGLHIAMNPAKSVCLFNAQYHFGEVGGDFLGLLIRKDTLREDWARFYIAEMILCIEEERSRCASSMHNIISAM
jgi:hypothetical protein